MMSHVLPALTVFGALFVLCLFGLSVSNAASARLHALRPRDLQRDGVAPPTPNPQQV